MRAPRAQRGMTLIDVVVSSALLLVVFLGIMAAFQLTVDVVYNNKARAGAITLAGERLEYVRSLSYAQIGTSGGIPGGSIEQTEDIGLNGTSYVRRTYVEYADDPLDGLGVADENGVVADYKAVKVEVSWTVRGIAREVELVSRFSPPGGVESSVEGGTLTINVVDTEGEALSNAEVTIANTTVSPNVQLVTYTNASGTASLIGAPVGSGYAVSVTKPGYSTARTYAVTANNTDPNPAHLTVAQDQTTTGTFTIGVLGAKVVHTYGAMESDAWSDTFADDALVGTSTNIEVSGGGARFAGSQPWSAPADLRSVVIEPEDISSWGVFSWDDTRPTGTSIAYSIYYWTGSGAALIPDSVLAGNGAGFTASGVDLSGVPVDTYPRLVLGARLSAQDANAESPSVDDWELTYSSATPFSATLRLTSATAIGSGPGGTVYKYDEEHTTDANGARTIAGVEPDAYTFSSDASTGYDISTACAPQPETLPPGGSTLTRIYLSAHTAHSLLVDVRATSTSSLITSAEVGVYRPGFAATSTTNACGQAFFPGLAQDDDYSITVIRSGYQSASITGVDVDGASRRSVTLQ